MNASLNTSPSRRAFLEKLGLAAASIGFASVFGRSAFADTASVSSPLFEPRIHASIGEEYLAAYPDDGDASKLVSDLFGVEMDQADTLSQQEIGSRLAGAIRRDFEEGRVAKLRNWRLSRSECQFFALQTLLRRSS